MPDQILVTDTVVAELHDESITVEEVGVRLMRGVDAPLVLWRIAHGTETRDPVCGAGVGAIAAARLSRGGQALAFCSEECLRKYVEDPNPTVIVKEIRSRKVYVIGEVTKPGTFLLASEMTVLQAIAEAGGFLEHANKGNVVVVRNEKGGERRFKFNYNEVVRGKNTQQNIRLLPGDAILVR